MMKKSLFFLGLTALTLASCSQEDVLSINNRLQDRNAIAFTARTPKTTRANDMTTNGLESFMVYGMKGDINERDEDPSYKLTDFFGGAVEFKRVFNTDDEAYPETYFMSDMPYYYPGDGSPLTFVAYAPSDLKNVTLDDQCKLSFSEFTVNEDITEQLDPVFDCTPNALYYDESGEPNIIYLTFKHALTKVFVSAAWKGSDNPYNYEVAGVKFGNIAVSGNCQYDDRNCDEEIGEELWWFEWSPGQSSNELVYIFDEPIEIGESSTPLMSGGMDQEQPDRKGSFLMIPQQLKAELSNTSESAEYNSVKSYVFKEGVSYIALLLRITRPAVQSGEEIVVYPFEQGVANISEEVDGKTYAWAAFPVGSKWTPNCYTDYVVDFSKGAGFVAPGAEGIDEENSVTGERLDLEYTPILGQRIIITEEIGTWDNGDAVTVDHQYEATLNQGTIEDPFLDD
ncbi:MAG: fimbrillin family protein [Bacteroides sp.]|nr:fimbrillin family protein [Bacteroides sp.]